MCVVSLRFEVNERIGHEATGDPLKLLMHERRKPDPRLKAVIRKPPTFQHIRQHFVTHHHAAKEALPPAWNEGIGIQMRK